MVARLLVQCYGVPRVLSVFQIGKEETKMIKLKISLSKMIATVLLLSSTALAQAENLNATSALSVAERWALVVGQADIPGLNDLLSNDYMHIHATALVESKAKFIDALQSGARKYDPIKIEESTVRVFGEAAVVSGKFALKATTRDRVIESVNRFSLVVVQTPKGLQVANFQATAIPQAK
jgi:hypothetical protein